jgi:DNA polymerase sliding clamp subunit (PCNA homolog)
VLLEKKHLGVNLFSDLEISFNSRYLLYVASQLDGNKIELFFNDTGSPVLIKDSGDFDSIFVVMPMKG